MIILNENNISSHNTYTLFVLQLYIISEYSINLIKEYSIDLIEQVTSVKQVTDDSQFQDLFENK